MAMLLVFSRNAITPLDLVVASLLAGAASFSSFQGLLAWPVGLLVILWCSLGRARKLSYAVMWLAAGALTTGLYYWHYTFQGGGSIGLGFDIRNPQLVTEYFLAAVGTVFPMGGAGSVSLHALIGIPLSLAGIWVLAATGRTRARTAGPHALPFPATLILFALLFDASIALGRVSLGMVGALASRDTMANLLLVLGNPPVRLRAHADVADRVFDEHRSSASPARPDSPSSSSPRSHPARSTASNMPGPSSWKRVQAARIAVNLSDIPVVARGQLVSDDVFAPYRQDPIDFTIVRQDQLGAFAPGPYEHYRALGPPATLVRQTLAVFRQSRTAWCRVSRGETLTHVTAQMGQPTGTEFAFWAAVLQKRFHTAVPYAGMGRRQRHLCRNLREGPREFSLRLLGDHSQSVDGPSLPRHSAMNS